MNRSQKVQILTLLGLAYKNGIKLLCKSCDLEIIPPDTNVDLVILQKIEKNKEILYEYLMSKAEDLEMDKTLSNRTDKLKLNSDTYYEIPEIHHHYWWVDSSIDMDFKRMVYLVKAFEVKGDLNTSIAESALICLLERHEILRTNFHSIGGKYFMKISDLDQISSKIDFLDTSKLLNSIDIDNFINYHDNEFDLCTGPFLLVRIATLSKNNFIVSFKAHHCIYDAWSLEIIKRDLIEIYTSLLNRHQFDLPKLLFHYKDYMYVDLYKKKQLSEQHKSYWQNYNKVLPPEMKIPGELPRVSESKRYAAYLNFSITPDLKAYLKQMAIKFKTTLFIILQAAFKSYIFELTGQSDIVIGTILFNRDDFIGLENQVGPYAKTVLIRSKLQSLGFENAIRDVKMSNDDLRRYSSYSLLENLYKLIPKDQTINGSFWKINLYYQESDGFGTKKHSGKSNNHGLEVRPYVTKKKEMLININIEIRFINIDNAIDLIISYDQHQYELQTINNFIKGFISFIEKEFHSNFRKS